MVGFTVPSYVGAPSSRSGGNGSGVREIEFEDLESVAELFRGVGWRTPIREDWERFWVWNPAIDPERPRICRGWVLQDKGKVVGSLYNVEQLYQLGERTLRVAVAANFVVDPAFRGRSMQLILAYARQTGVDLLLNTTASPQASKIFEFSKFQRLPQASYDRSYFWVLRLVGFSDALLRKRGFGKTTSRLGSFVLAPLLWAEARVRRRGLPFRSGSLTIKVIGADVIDDVFDELWHRKVAEGRRLLAHRTSKALRWHFWRRSTELPTCFVCAYDGPRLAGYIAIVRQDAQVGLRRARVADIFAERDDADTIRQLLDAAAQEARKRGAEMLEVIGFPEHIRRIMGACRPFELRKDAWPFLYKAIDPELGSELSFSDAWYPCLFDGDGSL